MQLRCTYTWSPHSPLRKLQEVTVTARGWNLLLRRYGALADLTAAALLWLLHRHRIPGAKQSVKSIAWPGLGRRVTQQAGVREKQVAACTTEKALSYFCIHTKKCCIIQIFKTVKALNSRSAWLVRQPAFKDSCLVKASTSFEVTAVTRGGHPHGTYIDPMKMWHSKIGDKLR